jgi:hypothetical protein
MLIAISHLTTRSEVATVSLSVPSLKVMSKARFGALLADDDPLVVGVGDTPQRNGHAGRAGRPCVLSVDSEGEGTEECDEREQAEFHFEMVWARSREMWRDAYATFI